MKPEVVRVVLVGAGGMGRCHLRTWKELPGVAVVGLYDAVPAVARRVAEQFGIRKAYPSLGEAVSAPDADAVVVCTPNMFHKEGVVAALQAGKHCLCEKPLAVSTADIRAMIAARDQSGKLLMTAQHLRFEQRSQTLKRIVAAKRLGQVYYARAWWLRRRLAPITPGFLSKAQAGHGPGMDLGVHVLDLAMHLLDHPRPVSVTGVSGCHLGRRPDLANQWGAFRPEDFEVEDFAAGLIRFADGAALSLEVSWLFNMVEPELYGVWLYGTEGGVRWPELKVAHVQDDVLVDSQIVSGLGTDGYTNEMLAFVEAVRTNGPSPVTAEQSLAVAQVLEALYQSAQTGGEVRLDSAARG
jgi:predicted dehydrogenase